MDHQELKQPQELNQEDKQNQELKIDNPQELKNHNDITGFLKIRIAGKLSPEEQKILYSNIREAHKNKGQRVYVIKSFSSNTSTLHIYNKGSYVAKGHHKRPKKYNVKPREPRPKKNYYKPTGRPVGFPKGQKHTKPRAPLEAPRKDKGKKRTSYKKTQQEDLLNNLKNELSQEEYNKLLSIINKDNTKEELSISNLSLPVC